MMELPKIGIEFDEERHLYRLDGVILPSVTQIMKPLSDEKYKNIPEEILRKAAYRGTVIHEAIENYIKYDFLDVPEGYEGYLNGFLEFKEEYQPEFLASEFRMAHKFLGYAGTCDLLCMIDGELNLVDFKNTSVINEGLCRVQLEAYSQALSSHGIKVQQRRILQFKSDGTWMNMMFSPDAEAWRVFGSLKVIYDYKKTM